MERLKNKSSNSQERLYGILAFILGLVVCNDVVYVFKFSNTYINIAVFYSCLLFFCFFLFKNKDFVDCFRFIPSVFYLYVVFVLFSTFMAIITFFNYAGMLIRHINGLGYYVLILTSLFNVIMLREQKQYIIKGLLAGFIINILVSLYAYWTFNAGNVFSLRRMFPQGAFFYPRYSFRSQGVFLEPSYFTSFLISVVFILLSVYRLRTGKSLFTAIAFLLTIVLSTSGNIIILIAAGIVYYFMNRKWNKKEKQKRTVTIGAVLGYMAMLLCVIFFWDRIADINFYSFFTKGIAGADLSDKSNMLRTQNMINALNLIPEHLFGVGWNMVHSLLQVNYGALMKVHSSFNYFITSLLELGILGTISYCLFIYDVVHGLLIKGKSLYQNALGISILAMFACQIANGSRYYNFMFVVFGLALIEIYENKKTNLDIQKKLTEKAW